MPLNDLFDVTQFKQLFRIKYKIELITIDK